jgi:hypothetical protein
MSIRDCVFSRKPAESITTTAQAKVILMQCNDPLCDDMPQAIQLVEMGLVDDAYLAAFSDKCILG